MDKVKNDIFRILKLMEIKHSEIEGEDLELDEESEISEEGESDAGSTSGGGASTGYPTVTKWETGAARGPANPIGNAPRADKVTRGKANTLL